MVSAGQLREKIDACRAAMVDSQTPWSAKVLLFLAAAYLACPVDLIPDFIPVIGWLDDLVIVPFLVWLAFRQIYAAKKTVGKEDAVMNQNCYPEEK